MSEEVRGSAPTSRDLTSSAPTSRAPTSSDQDRNGVLVRRDLLPGLDRVVSEIAFTPPMRLDPKGDIKMADRRDLACKAVVVRDEVEVRRSVVISDKGPAVTRCEDLDHRPGHNRDSVVVLPWVEIRDAAFPGAPGKVRNGPVANVAMMTTRNENGKSVVPHAVQKWNRVIAREKVADRVRVVGLKAANLEMWPPVGEVLQVADLVAEVPAPASLVGAAQDEAIEAREAKKRGPAEAKRPSRFKHC